MSNDTDRVGLLKQVLAKHGMVVTMDEALLIHRIVLAAQEAVVAQLTPVLTAHETLLKLKDDPKVVNEPYGQVVEEVLCQLREEFVEEQELDS